MFTSKWFYLVVVLLVGLVILYIAGRKTFHASIIIPASPEKVWSVLMDTEAYQYWHPLLIPTEGNYTVGKSIKYLMTQPNGKQSEFVTKVVSVETGKFLKQHAGVPLILTAEHEYRLEKVEGGTRVVQHEVDNGIAMLFWDSSWVQPTYEKVNKALKKRVMELQTQ